MQAGKDKRKIVLVMFCLPFAQVRSAFYADIAQGGRPVWPHPSDTNETRVAPAKIQRAKEKEAGCLFCAAPVHRVSLGRSAILRLHQGLLQRTSAAGPQASLPSLPHHLCLLTRCH